MSFNYLGQLDQVLSPDSIYHVAQEASGATRNLNDPRLYLLEVDGYISTGKLKMNWVSSRRLHRVDTLHRLGVEFLAVLRELIKGCRTSTTSSLVPSDFPLANLSQQKLDKITRKLSARKGSQSR
jgi:non-ribosomal peptide synthase protein (TIGR01720 family)